MCRAANLDRLLCKLIYIERVTLPVIVFEAHICQKPRMSNSTLNKTSFLKNNFNDESESINLIYVVSSQGFKEE